MSRNLIILLGVVHFTPCFVTYLDLILLHRYSLKHAAHCHSSLLRFNGASSSITTYGSFLVQRLYQSSTQAYAWLNTLRASASCVAMLIYRTAVLNYNDTPALILITLWCCTIITIALERFGRVRRR